MDELPDLPFEQILSYLSLQDLIKSRTVCRAWKMKADNFRVKSLCYSTNQFRNVYQKKQSVSGAFAQNFIGSRAFEAFFNTFASSILSNLKHLRLCELTVKRKFAETLNSFSRLEELDIIRFKNLQTVPFHLKVNLPMLNSIRLERWCNVEKLTLDAPRLKKVQHLYSSFRLDLVHGESVERLVTENSECIEVKKLKNLKYFYWADPIRVDSEFLFSLNRLKEIHLCRRSNVRNVFEQKNRFGRADLKIYLTGLLCDSLDDLEKSGRTSSDYFVHVVENPSRLADEIPIGNGFDYKLIERVAPGSEIPVVSRHTSLSYIIISQPVQDIERFLDFLKRFDRIVDIEIEYDQQELLERLPEHCEVEWLKIHRPLSDLTFVFRMNHLVHLTVKYSVDAETISKVFEKLPSLGYFYFEYNQKKVQIRNAYSGEFSIRVGVGEKTMVPDLSAAIEFITKTAEPTVEEMEE